MIREADCPAGVWNYHCPTCRARRGFKCDVGGHVSEDVHMARLRAYRADPTWTPEVEAADRFGGTVTLRV